MIILQILENEILWSLVIFGQLNSSLVKRSLEVRDDRQKNATKRKFSKNYETFT